MAIDYPFWLSFGGTPRPGRRLAAGSMAQIYELEEGPDFVLKLAREVRYNPMLLQEARLSAELRHEALLPVLDHGLDERGLAWLILPRLSGQTLSGFAMDTPALIDALTPVADALDALHHHGWVHGDLKPHNLLENRSAGGVPVLLSDLGLAGREGEKAEGGSPAYSSPSRLSGGALSRADDHFAFAVVLFEAMTGRLPFIGLEGEALLRSIHRGEMYSLTVLSPGLPAELEALLRRPLEGKTLERGLLAWTDRLRAVLGMDPAPATLFYASAAYPRPASLDKVADWIKDPPGEQTRLGRAALLRGGGSREAALMRTALADRVALPWISSPSLDSRSWIAWLEGPAEGVAAPAIFSSAELDTERVDYLLHRADTLILEKEDWNLEDLPRFLQAGLSTAAHSVIEMGEEESRFILETSGRDLGRAEAVMADLIAEGILRGEWGQALFRAPRSEWEPIRESRIQRPGFSTAAHRLLGLLNLLAVPLRYDECAALLGLGSLALEAAREEIIEGGFAELVHDGEFIHALGHGAKRGPTAEGVHLDPRRFPVLWERASDRPEARLSLLAQALRQEASGWLSSLDSQSLLELGDQVSLARLDAFMADPRVDPLPGALALMACLADFRGGRLPEAVKNYWTCEENLDLVTSAELSRRLFTDLLNHKSLEEGFHFLDRWREARAGEIAGSELEIRVAAREAMSHGRFGSVEAGLEAVESSREHFAGRPGLWYLDWAEGLIHAERRDRASAAGAMTRALEAMPESADPRDRFSLCIQIANHHVLLFELDAGREYLDRAEKVASQTGAPEFTRYLEAAKALLAGNSGDVEGSEIHNRRALRLAKESGLWREPVAERNNLASALLRQGKYGRLVPLLREIERHVEVAEQFLSATQERNFLSWAALVLGDLEACDRYLRENLALAAETKSLSLMGMAVKRRGMLKRVLGEDLGALRDFQLAEESYGEALSSSSRNGLRLLILDLQERRDHEAEDEIRAIITQARDRSGRFLLCQALGMRVRLLCRRGDLSAAHAAFQDALPEVEAVGDLTGLSWFWAEGAELDLALGDRAAARRALGRALEILQGLAEKLPSHAARRRFLARPDRLVLLKRYQELAGD